MESQELLAKWSFQPVFIYLWKKNLCSGWFYKDIIYQHLNYHVHRRTLITLTLKLNPHIHWLL